MNNERLPQRFRYRKPSCNGWDFGVVYPMGKRWHINAGAGFGSFESDPWEILGHIIGDVDEFQWIDNDYGWPGDVMPRGAPPRPDTERHHPNTI